MSAQQQALLRDDFYGTCKVIYQRDDCYMTRCQYLLINDFNIQSSGPCLTLSSKSTGHHFVKIFTQCPAQPPGIISTLIGLSFIEFCTYDPVIACQVSIIPKIFWTTTVRPSDRCVKYQLYLRSSGKPLEDPVIAVSSINYT